LTVSCPNVITTKRVTDPFSAEGHLVIEPDDSKILWADNELKEIWNRKFSHVAQESGSLVPAVVSTARVMKKQKQDLPMAPQDPATPEGSDDEIPY